MRSSVLSRDTSWRYFVMGDSHASTAADARATSMSGVVVATGNRPSSPRFARSAVARPLYSAGSRNVSTPTDAKGGGGGSFAGLTEASAAEVRAEAGAENAIAPRPNPRESAGGAASIARRDARGAGTSARPRSEGSLSRTSSTASSVDPAGASAARAGTALAKRVPTAGAKMGRARLAAVCAARGGTRTPPRADIARGVRAAVRVVRGRRALLRGSGRARGAVWCYPPIAGRSATCRATARTSLRTVGALEGKLVCISRLSHWNVSWCFSRMFTKNDSILA